MKNFYIYLTNNLHPTSLIVTIALDLVWSVFEGGLTASIIGILAIPLLMATIFLVELVTVTLIQRYAAYDDWPAALVKGFGLGVFAALPFSFVGLALGAVWGVLHMIYGVDQEVILLGKLTLAWRDIEGSLRRLAPPEYRQSSTEEIINILFDGGMITATTRSRLHELRKLRNINTHEFSTTELEVLVDEVIAMRDSFQDRSLP